MTKIKSTKRALLMSGLALLVCFSMLVGSTFAWFTDSVTSGSNVIQSGTLDIVMEYWDGDSWENAEGQVLEFVKGGNYGGVTGDVLWEPGCTYQLPKIRVRNEGNLAAKVLIRLNGITGDEKLMEAIDLTTTITNMPESVLNGSFSSQLGRFNNATIDLMYGTPDGTLIFDWSLMAKGHVSTNSGHTDTSPEFTITGHMKEEAGNEYQGLTIEGVSITALATQEVYEYDSFGREYDANATLPVVVTTAADLKAALANGGEIELGTDIELANNETIVVASGVETNLNLNGHKISSTANKTGNQEQFLVKGTMNISNGSVELLAENNQGWGAMATIFDVTAGGVLNMENVTASVSGTDMNFIVHLNNWGEVTLNVNNCDFTASYVAVRAFNSGYDMNNVTIKNTDVFGGGRLFWAHNYTSEGKDDTTLNLDIYGNNNTSEHEAPVRFGFSVSETYDLDGNVIA